MKDPFSSEDRERIAKAVSEAEGRTSGEIVTYYVERSDDYEEGLWRAGVIAAGLTMITLIILRQTTEIWMPGLTESLLMILGVGSVGIGLAYLIRPLRLFLAGPALVQRRVDARAMEAFVEQEVFATRDRTGILIFLSLYEHRVEVIGDSGINAKVAEDAWSNIVSIVTEHMKRKEPGAGLVKAVEKCGDLLELKGVAIRKDDTNELSNQLQRGE